LHNIDLERHILCRTIYNLEKKSAKRIPQPQPHSSFWLVGGVSVNKIGLSLLAYDVGQSNGIYRGNCCLLANRLVTELV